MTQGCFSDSSDVHSQVISNAEPSVTIQISIFMYDSSSSPSPSHAAMHQSTSDCWPSIQRRPTISKISAHL